MPKARKYGAIGASDGAWLMTDYIPIKKGLEYRITAWVRSHRTAVKIFIKGYAQLPVRVHPW